MVDALRQRREKIFAAHRVVVTFERGSRASQDHDAFLDSRADDGDIPRIIARGLFLLVSVLVFFIDNNQPEFFERRENRAAWADHNSGTTGMNLVPFIMALALG